MNSIERAWRDILFDIYKNGHIHKKDDAEIKEIVAREQALRDEIDKIIDEIGIRL